MTININPMALDNVCKMIIGYVLEMPETTPQYLEKLMSSIEFLEATMGEPSIPSVICYILVLERLPQSLSRKIPRPIYKYLQDNLFEIEELIGRRLKDSVRPEVIVTKKPTLILADGTEVEVGKKPEIILQ